MSRAKSALSLDEWYVISLRPLGQHAGVRRAAAQFGARTFALSTLLIEPLDAGATLENALACATVIVTSPNAARLARAPGSLQSRRGQRWFAPGLGTAAALRRRGIDEVCIPAHGTDSEALLVLPALADLTGQSVGLITAPGGRGLLAKTLLARGAQLRVAEVYRRVAHAPTAQRLRALTALPKRTALLLSSSEAFASLWQSLSAADQIQLIQRLCVVSSGRLATQAAALGFTHILLATSAQPKNLLATLAAHASEQRFR